jgi:hypothetical protein
VKCGREKESASERCEFPLLHTFENNKTMTRTLLLLLLALVAGARASAPLAGRERAHLIKGHQPLPDIDGSEPDPPVWPRSFEVRTVSAKKENLLVVVGSRPRSRRLRREASA